MKGFREIPVSDFNEDVIGMISRQWMLVTAGDRSKYNTMTASWGGIGFVWNKPAATVYIRPQRYTEEFVEVQERLSLSFLPERYRAALTYCGSHSGRDEDKMAHAGLTAEFTAAGTPVVAEAELILECRKMYKGRLEPEGFTEPRLIGQWYPERDFHYLYICEIEKVYLKE